MPNRIWALVATALLACSKPSERASSASRGRVVVALTIDWEGAYLSDEGLDALDVLRRDLGATPLTHFVSAAYFTKAQPDPTVVRTLTGAIRAEDELALHLHGWRSLAQKSGIEPKLSPSFLKGTDELLEFEDGDVGFDLDLDAYGVPELRALVKTSKTLLGNLPRPLSTSFRAGGYLGTPKVLEAIQGEGFTVDSSASDHRQLDELTDGVFPRRVRAIWPKADSASQPWMVAAGTGSLLEMPIAAFADYTTAAEIVAIFEQAHARLRASPSVDVFVVLGFHQETAHEFGPRLAEALATVRGREELAKNMHFTTIENAAILARAALAPASK